MLRVPRGGVRYNIVIMIMIIIYYTMLTTLRRGLATRRRSRSENRGRLFNSLAHGGDAAWRKNVNELSAGRRRI